jgi:hypothetical protein
MGEWQNNCRPYAPEIYKENLISEKETVMFKRTNILRRAIIPSLIAFILLSSLSIAQIWTPLNGPFITSNIKDISVDNSGSYVYIADNNYVMKSTNGGTAWFVTATPYSSPSLVLVKQSDVLRIITTKNTELRYSTDGGLTWNLGINDASLNPTRLVAAINDNSKMLLGRKYVEGVSSIGRSYNGGANWNPVTQFLAPTDISDFSALAVNDPDWPLGTIWACGSAPPAPSGQPEGISPQSISSNAGLWSSINYGETWQAYDHGNKNIRSIALGPACYSSTDYQIFFVEDVSGDNDILWKDINRSHPELAINCFSSATEIHMVRYNPNNNTVFLATNNGLYRSTDATDASTTDGGGTWDLVGYANSDVQAVAIWGANTVFAATATAINKSTDNGATWVEVGRMNVSSVEASNGTVWSVSADNNFISKYNGSSFTNYSISSVGTNFYSEKIYRHSCGEVDYLYASGAQNNIGSIFRSQDGGQNFSLVYTVGSANSKINGTVAHPTTCSWMYAYGGGSVNGTWKNIFYSTNTGATWMPTDQVLGSGNNIINELIVFKIGEVSYMLAAVNNGNIYKYDGMNWNLVKSVGTNAYSIALNPTYPSVIYASGTSGIFKSTDYGVGWSTNPIRSGGVRRLMMNPSQPTSTNHVILITEDNNTMQYTSNGGSTWTTITDILPYPIKNFKNDPSLQQVLYAGTGTGIYRATKPGSTILISPPNQLNPTIPINVTFDWAAVISTSSYHLIVDDENTFASPRIIDNSNITSDYYHRHLPMVKHIIGKLPRLIF